MIVMHMRFRRRIEGTILDYFKTDDAPILLIDGARQIGKSYIVRELGKEHYRNYVEINLAEDKDGNGIFRDIRDTRALYMAIQSISGRILGDSKDTLVFIDEVQEYPHILTMFKFLRQENRYKFIASGSLLGVTLRKSASIPVGSVSVRRMYPMNFTEFLWANGIDDDLIGQLQDASKGIVSVPDGIHLRMMRLFKDYLICGGLPYCVNLFLEGHEIVSVRDAQLEIFEMYKTDASRYDEENKLRTRLILDLVPSMIENKKKRIYAKDIESKDKARFANYREDFETLVCSGVVLETVCCANPAFRLLESAKRNMVKLYMADIGLLTAILYRYNVTPFISEQSPVNLGNVYETVVAIELASNGHDLFYTDNKRLGEVDFLVDDYDTLGVKMLEVKSGKDFRNHRSLDNYLGSDNGTSQGIVLSNNPQVERTGDVTYMPIYMSTFI